MTYRPGSISLTIQQVRLQDYGPHVCSVSKRDEFWDYSVELTRASGESDGRGGRGLGLHHVTEPFASLDPSHLVTSAPNSRQTRSGGSISSR